MHKWGNGERLWLATCVGLSFLDICGQRTMTNKGAKRNVPHLLQAQQDLSVCGQCWKRSSAKSSTASSPSQLFSRRVCWSLTVQWGSVSADFSLYSFSFPADIRRKNDVVLTSMRRDDVASTSIQHHFGTICSLGSNKT